MAQAQTGVRDRHDRDPRAPSRAPSASSQRSPSNSRAAASVEVARRAEIETAIRAGQRRAERQQRLVRSRPPSHPAAPATRRVVRHHQPGRAQRPAASASHADAARDRADRRASSASTVTPPGRSRTRLPRRSGRARSIQPRPGTAPLSSTAAIRPASPSSTCRAVVGLTCAGAVGRRRGDRRPALRAAAPAPRHAPARAPPAYPARRRSAARPDNPARRGSTSVSGPGQNAPPAVARRVVAIDMGESGRRRGVVADQRIETRPALGRENRRPPRGVRSRRRPGRRPSRCRTRPARPSRSSAAARAMPAASACKHFGHDARR